MEMGRVKFFKLKMIGLPACECGHTKYAHSDCGCMNENKNRETLGTMFCHCTNGYKFSQSANYVNDEESIKWCFLR